MPADPSTDRGSALPSPESDNGPPARPGSEPGRPAYYHPWLHAYAMLLTLAIFTLIAIGGNVTSRGAGMAVPDWPTTFGYNMFLAPIHVWWSHSDRFWEHFHRLVGSFVGLLTIGMVIWLALTQSGFRLRFKGRVTDQAVSIDWAVRLWARQHNRLWLIVAGVTLLVLVCVQGLMGGLRVTENSIPLATIHGITGQIILGTTVLIAAATSRKWLAATQTSSTADAPSPSPSPSIAIAGQDELLPRPGRGLRYLSIALLVVMVCQLILGAIVRHSLSGLAIPDFPTAYGHLLPPTDASQVSPYSLGQVWVHFAHRVWALVVVCLSLALVVRLNLRAAGQRLTKWPARVLLLLLGLQVAAGASVIWSGRYPEIATLHQALGAALLAVATWLVIRIHLLDHAASQQGETVSVHRSADVSYTDKKDEPVCDATGAVGHAAVTPHS